MEKLVKLEQQKYSKKKIINTVILSIFIAILSFLVFCAGWLFVDKFINKSPAPSLFGYSQFVIVTDSMSGTIEKGDVIITKKTNDYKVGDIITFISQGESMPITHRIILIEGDNIFTKGDAVQSADVLPIAKEDVLGKVIKVIPKLGKLSSWLSEGGGYIYILAIIVIIVITIFLYNFAKAKNLQENVNDIEEEGGQNIKEEKVSEQTNAKRKKD